jgi:fructosamine-3-kinase
VPCLKAPFDLQDFCKTTYFSVRFECEMINPCIIDALAIPVSSVKPLPGGDANQAFCITSASAVYFLKINDASLFPQMFRKEADGLNALRQNSNFRIPQVIDFGTAGGQQFLLLEWIHDGIPALDFWGVSGASLAGMHATHQQFFGWK